MTTEELSWLTKAAVLVWVAKQLALSDPVDPLYKICIFCEKIMGFNAPTQAHTEQCAWRVAKELFPG